MSGLETCLPDRLGGLCTKVSSSFGPSTTAGRYTDFNLIGVNRTESNGGEGKHAASIPLRKRAMSSPGAVIEERLAAQEEKAAQEKTEVTTPAQENQALRW